MKSKAPFSSPGKQKCSSDSAKQAEDNSADDQSSKQAVENNSSPQLNQPRLKDESIIWNSVTRAEIISVLKELGSDKQQLDKETWRLNEQTRSGESIWGRLLSKLKLDETEKIRHSLYNFWRRNRQKLAADIADNRFDSVEEDDSLERDAEAELPSSNSEMKSVPSDASVLHRDTRSTVQQRLNLPTIVEASFVMNHKEWKKIYDDSTRKMEPGWTNVIYRKVSSCNFRCTLAFQTHKVGAENSRKKNSSFFRCIATCKNTCQRVFEIFIKEEPLRKESFVVRIRAVGDENHDEDGKAVARHLTAKERLDVGKEAALIGSLKVFREKVENADEEMLVARNFTGCESVEVLKHAAADYRKQFRLDEDIFQECRIRQNIIDELDTTSVKMKGYVQAMAEKPFRLHLTSEAQVERFSRYCKKSTYSHIHIDATGSIVKSLPHQKIVLLYAAVFKDGDDPTNVIPLAHAILTDHTATSISYFLGTLRQHIVTLNDKVVRPSFFVTDFSPAIFNAILQAFNHEDIHAHLKRCWNVIQRKYDVVELRSKSFVRFCCSHMMHTFARSLSAANVAKGTRKNVMHVFALFINCGELELAFKFLKRVLHMFGDPHATDAEAMLQRFLDAPYDDETTPEKIGPCEVDVDDDSIDPLDEVDETIHSSKAIIHQSPFNVEALRRFPELSALLNSRTKYENVTNPLFCRRIILVFYKWFAYLPLWTSLLTEFEGRYSKGQTPVDIRRYEQGRLTNAQVECYFGVLKDSVFERKTNLRPAEVIVSLYRNVQVQLKADRFGVSQNVKNRKGKLKDMNVEEAWGKKRAQKKQRSTYFSRIDKYTRKRLASKPASPNPKQGVLKLKPISPQLKLASPKPKPTSPGQKKGTSDKLSLVSRNLFDATINVLNDITNITCTKRSPDASPSKLAGSISDVEFLKKTMVLMDTRTASASNMPKSPPNIFDSLKPDLCTFADNLIKKKVPSDNSCDETVKENSLTSIQKKENLIKTVEIRRGTRQRQGPLRVTFMTPDRPPTKRRRQSFMIDQCSLTWPTFGITKTIFEGRTYSVTNTCNIDAPLFAIYVIYSTEPIVNDIILNSPNEPFLSLRNTLSLVESDGWDEARLYWLISNGILDHQSYKDHNAYGSVDGNFLRFIKNPAQLHQHKSICSRLDCPTRERTIKSADIGLDFNLTKVRSFNSSAVAGSWEASISKFSDETITRCGNFVKSFNEIPSKEAKRLGYRRYRRKIENIHTNTTEEEDGWLCNGEVISEASYFIHGPPPFLVVDIVHRSETDPTNDEIVQIDLNFHDIQRVIRVGASTYHLRATINHDHDHFTATFLDSSNHLFLYNDLQGVKMIDQSPFYAETAVYVLEN